MRLVSKIFLVVFYLVLSNCAVKNSLQKDLKRKDYFLKVIPAGTIKIHENFFYDETEISNLSYVEYLYWTRQIFGAKSVQYLYALPDTSVWSAKNKCMLVNDTYYLRHPAYRDYPVVGISKAQADSFAKWRSDRVFEFLLIEAKKISSNYNQNLENHFTIDRYFEGMYAGYTPDTNYIYFPCYRLPSLAEYKKALLYADSIDTKTSKQIYCEIITCINDTLRGDATTSVYFPKAKVKAKYIYNLRGNVKELTSENGLSEGGGWSDKRQTITSRDTFYMSTPNAMTGFRNVCEWKRWTKKSP